VTLNVKDDDYVFIYFEKIIYSISNSISFHEAQLFIILITNVIAYRALVPTGLWTA